MSWPTRILCFSPQNSTTRYKRNGEGIWCFICRAKSFALRGIAVPLHQNPIRDEKHENEYEKKWERLCYNKRAEWRTRTADPRITNALLYQLSQFGFFLRKNPDCCRDSVVPMYLALRSLLQQFGIFSLCDCKGTKKMANGKCLMEKMLKMANAISFHQALRSRCGGCPPSERWLGRRDRQGRSLSDIRVAGSE